MKSEEIRKLYVKKDKMHNFNHILRIKKRVAIIKKPYKSIDEDLLKFLILFHGLKDYIKDNKDKFPKEYVNSLMKHSKNPTKIEEKIVFDANMLDNVGKRGIKKALFVGKKIRRSKKGTYDYLKKNIRGVKFYTKIGKKLGKKELNIMKNNLK